VWPRGWVEVQLYSSMTAALEGGKWSAARPGRTLPPVPILQEAGWALGPVWTGGKSRPHRDSIPDHPSRSQSLYRLSYPVHEVCVCVCVYIYIYVYTQTVCVYIYIYVCVCVYTQTHTKVIQKVSSDGLLKKKTRIYYKRSPYH